jgi:hypothetical protein
MEITRRQYLAAYRELGSSTCGGCGGKKRDGQSFCRNCYYSLPPQTRSKLYDSSGYAETYTEAKDLLLESKGEKL